MRFLSGIALFLIISLASCTKTPDSFVIVHVQDSAGLPVPSATVQLSGQPTDSVHVNKVTLYDLSLQTDENGKALFRFTEFYQDGPDGFAILDVDVTEGARTGHELVKLLEGETSEVTVVVQ